MNRLGSGGSGWPACGLDLVGVGDAAGLDESAVLEGVHHCVTLGESLAALGVQDCQFGSRTVGSDDDGFAIFDSGDGFLHQRFEALLQDGRGGPVSKVVGCGCSVGAAFLDHSAGLFELGHEAGRVCCEQVLHASPLILDWSNYGLTAGVQRGIDCLESTLCAAPVGLDEVEAERSQEVAKGSDLVETGLCELVAVLVAVTDYYDGLGAGGAGHWYHLFVMYCPLGRLKPYFSVTAYCTIIIRKCQYNLH